MNNTQTKHVIIVENIFTHFLEASIHLAYLICFLSKWNFEWILNSRINKNDKDAKSSILNTTAIAIRFENAFLCILNFY